MKFLVVFVAIAVASGHAALYSWTLNELSIALEDPNTDPAMIPYLEHALNEMMTALHHGQQMEFITVDIPDHIDVWPIHDPAAHPETEPGFIDVWPIKDPAEHPEVAPVEVPAPAVSSPLVQIIVNVQQNKQVSEVAAPAAVAESEIIPTPVNVVEEAFVPEWHPAGQWGGWGPMI